jgi:NAD(P)-dependent dehydrogenase (short-subunit alcohol dehydrogenase family)
MMKTVLITGAKGGLGEALVSGFGKAGWQVIATDLEAAFPEGPKKIKNILEAVMDVASDESVDKAARYLADEKIQLDLIINNAGIDRYFPLSEAPIGLFRKVFEVNVFGSYRVNSKFLPILKKPGGRIIHISSEAVKINVPFMSYPVSKQALESYCRTLRQEMHFLGVEVCVIRPGAIRTPFLQNVKNAVNPVTGSLLSSQFDAFISQAYREIGKTVEAEEVAAYIIDIYGKKKWKPVYKINNSLQLTVAALLPFRITESIVYRRLR